MEEDNIVFDGSDVQIQFVDIDDNKWNDELAAHHKLEHWGQNTIFNPKPIQVSKKVIPGLNDAEIK